MSERALPVSIEQFRTRIKWFIYLRWLTVIAVGVVITATSQLLDVQIPLRRLYWGDGLLLVQNILYSLYNRHLQSVQDKGRWFTKANRFANVQIALDLMMLSYFIHLAGGVENPFISYFIFHMVIASILLSNRAAYLQATLVGVYLGIVFFGEYWKILPHYHLTGFLPENFCLLTNRYLPGVYFVAVSTFYITVYMATSIVNKWRQDERELAWANLILKEQDRLKSQYVFRVSHDLKSSLSTIQICLKVVLDNLAGVIAGKPREMIARAEHRSVELLHFVKDLLDLSRMRAGKGVEKNAVSLAEIAARAVKQLKSKAVKKKIEIVTEIPPDSAVWANEAAVEELLTNLLSNAVKYTPAGGKVRVQGGEAPARANLIQVAVSDTGIGIPPEDVPRVFDDFYRAENAQALEKEGTGLGLSIAKQIVDDHGGTVWVESQPGQGSTFYFTLPKAH